MNKPSSSTSIVRESPIQGLTAIHVAVFLFGLSGLLGKMLTLPPSAIVFSRALLAALALGLALHLCPSSPAPKLKHWLFFVVSGAVLTIHWLTFFQAIQISTVAIGLLSFSSFPLFVTILEPVVFRERLRIIDAFTCLLVIAGLILVLPNFDLNQHLTQGVAWGTASGFTFALLSILNRKYVQGLSPLLIGAGQNAVAAVILLPFACPLSGHLSIHVVFLLLILGILCTACAHVWFIRGLATVRAQVASVLTGLEPVYGIILAWIFLHEAPLVRTLLGGSLILGATILASYAPPRSLTSIQISSLHPQTKNSD